MIYSKEYWDDVEKAKNGEKLNYSGSSKNKKSDDNNVSNITVTNAIVYISKGGFKFIGRGWNLVKEGLTAKPVAYKSGIRFSMPWVKNAKIKSMLITTEIKSPLLNTVDNSQIEPIPVMDFVIEDFGKFYDVFCTSKKKDVITTDESDMNLLYSRVRDAVKTIVNECKFEVIKNYSYSLGRHNLPNGMLDLTNKINDIIFDIFDKYGVRIKRLTLEDTNLPIESQKKEDEKSRQKTDNDMMMAKAKLEAEIAKLKAEAESEKIRILAEAEAEKVRLLAEAEAERKRNIGIAESEMIAALLQNMPELTAEQRASIINTLNLPEGTININGGGQSGLLIAALAKYLSGSNTSMSTQSENTQENGHAMKK